MFARFSRLRNPRTSAAEHIHKGTRGAGNPSEQERRQPPGADDLTLRIRRTRSANRKMMSVTASNLLTTGLFVRTRYTRDGFSRTPPYTMYEPAQDVFVREEI